MSYLGHFGAKNLIYFSRAVGRIKNTAGLELVGLSRVSSPQNLAIVNSSISLCLSNLKKIGRNKINEKIKSFQTYLNNHSLYSCSKVEAEIRMADNFSFLGDEKTNENGCKCLLSWFNSLR